MVASMAESTNLPSMEQLLAEESCAPLQRGEIRRGVVVEIWPAYVVMDLRAKCEGFVPKKDLARLDEEVRERVVVGEEFPVYIVRPEDVEGQTIVSISRGLVQYDWDLARNLLESQEIWEGEVTDYNRGGLLVGFGQLRGFIPASHLVGFPRSLPPEERRQRLSDMIGQRLGLRVIEVNPRRNRLVLSERAAYREWREQQMERLFDQLEEGQRVKGRVSSLQNFGAFIDLGGVDGLVHISELDWTRVDHPRDVLQVGEEVEVVVLRLDRKRNRISLSLRQAGDDPWEQIGEQYRLGQLIDGQVTRVVDFGAFVEVKAGVEGLVHISELSEDNIGSPWEIVEEGEVVPVRVIRIDPSRRRLGLSLRQVTAQEWEEWHAQRLHIEQGSPEDPGTVEETLEEPEFGQEEGQPVRSPVPAE